MQTHVILRNSISCNVLYVSIPIPPIPSPNPYLSSAPASRQTFNNMFVGVVECFITHPGETLQILGSSQFNIHNKNGLEILCQEPVSK